MPELIDRLSLIDKLDHGQKKALDAKDFMSFYGLVLFKAILQNEPEIVKNQPTIEPEVRHGKGCKFCKGRAYSKKPLTVITRTMKRVEVYFNFCPNCGRDMRVTDTNVGGKGGETE